MPPARPETLIKQSAKRSVLRLGSDRIVKRFHAGGPLGRLRDGWRAAREKRALLTLRAAGLRAPLPLGVRPTGRGWELTMESVPGGQPLDALLQSGSLSRAKLGRLAIDLGRLLASLDRAALRHPDLHAGNVLIDDHLQPWLVDPARLRRTRHGGEAGRTPESALVRLAAGVRESSDPGFRRRFLAAFLAAAPGSSDESTEALAARIEANARQFRRQHVLARVPRWMRTSGATLPFQSGRTRGVRTHDPVPADTQVRKLRFDRLADGEAAWLQLARLVEHRLPHWAPVRFSFAPEVAIEVHLPERAIPLDGVPIPRQLGALLGALHDRGLRPPELKRNDLIATSGGKLLLGPVALSAVEPGDLGQGFEPWRQVGLWDWDALPAAAKRAFRAGFLGAQRAGREASNRIAARLPCE